MSNAAGHGHAPEGHGPGFDHEIHYKPIYIFMATIVGLSLFGFALGWGLFLQFRSMSVSQDPKPSPMPEMQKVRPRPMAALQVDPNYDMAVFREEESHVLASYAWIDKQAGVARIPVARAMDILLEKGLPPVSPPPAVVVRPGGPGDGAAGAANAAPPSASAAVTGGK